MQNFFRSHRLGFLIALLGATLGCVTIAEKRAMEQDLGSLQAQLEVLRNRIDIRSGETEESNQGQKTLADLKVSFEELREDLAKTNAQIESMRHYLEQEKQAQKKVQDDFELRFRDVENHQAELDKKLESAQKSRESSLAPAKESQNKSAIATSKVVDPSKSEKEEYEEATKIFRQKVAGSLKAEEAAPAEANLHRFLKNHPQSKYRPSVHFWLGEIYYGQKDYKRSIVEYDAVVTGDAKHQKAPGARLKQGYCFLALNEGDKARLFFQEVVSRYPKSKEAQAARGKLEELKATSSSEAKSASGSNP